MVPAAGDLQRVVNLDECKLRTLFEEVASLDVDLNVSNLSALSGASHSNLKSRQERLKICSQVPPEWVVVFASANKS